MLNILIINLSMPTINLGKSKPRDRTIAKDKYQSIYQSKTWRRLRQAKFATNPLCEVCEAKGIVKQTDEIHHIVPFEIDMSLVYEWDNLLSVCIDCHKELHKHLKIPTKAIKTT